MGIEIERKYLLVDDSWREQVYNTTEMVQGYFSSPETLAAGQKASLRIRIEKPGASWLSVKSDAVGLTRQEFEYVVDDEDAEQLLLLCVGAVVRKKRHLVRIDDRVWEIDEFLGENEGLIVAEVELPSEDTELTLPAWVGEEVSNERRYTNVALSSLPFKDWT